MQLPNANNLPIEILSQSFSETTTSYKFYWFLAILEDLTENNSSIISLEKLAIRMISKVWYPLDYFKLSFGKQDQFKQVSVFLSSKIKIDNSPNSENLFKQINKQLDNKELQSLHEIINERIKYVPYRLLRPFFKNELRGEDDHKIKNKIIEFAENEFDTRKPFYCFLGNSIKIHEEWKEYFIKHNYILQSFIYWHLLKYLQKNNPNVIGLSEKLFKPKQRDLKDANKFWKNYIEIKKGVNCIYSNTLITDNYSIDHFVPWTYIAHDQLWNLLPTTKSINSSKSDNLPNFDKYFYNFTDLQFDAFKIIFNSNLKDKKQVLEDYSIFFNSDLENINEFTKNKFQQKLEETIKPMLQFAENMGFNSNWIYK